MHRSDARTQRTLAQGLHFTDHLHQEEQLPVGGAGGSIRFFFRAPVVLERDDEARIDDVFAVLDVFRLTAPGLAVGRIGEHEVEGVPGKFVRRQGGAHADVFRVVALDHHVGLTDGVGLVVDLLAEQVHVAGSPNGAFPIRDEVLGFGQHPSRAAGRIVDGHDRWQLVFDGFENEVGHQVDHFPRRKVLARFLVVLFVEFADQLLEYVAHPEVGQGRQLAAIGIFALLGSEVDVGRGKFFQHVQQHVLGRQVPDLALQLELIDDLFDVRAEPIEVVLEVGLQDLLAVGSGSEKPLQGPFAGVVKHVPAGVFQSVGVPFGKAGLVSLESQLFHHRRFGGFQQRVEPA